MSPILDFLAKTCSPFLINAYPFYAYAGNSKDVSLDYDNILYVQIDAVHAALNKLGHKELPIQILETGWPSKGDDVEIGASKENANKYNGNLLKIVKRNNGTPAMPDHDLNIFVFALFNENLKPGPISERNYGLFKPDGTPAYDLGFSGISSGGHSGHNSSGTFPPPSFMFPPVSPGTDGYMPISSSAAIFNIRISISIILLSAVGWISLFM